MPIASPRSFFFSALAATVVGATTAVAQPTAQIEPIVTGLNEPWAIAPLGDGHVLITERDGALILAGPAGQTRVAGLPKVHVQGQGGLLDITLARDFDQTRTLFLTYAKKQRGGSGTTLARAQLSDDGTRLEEVTEIFEMKPGSSGGRHYGSRVVEAQDGTLFVTIGDRGDRDQAQDRTSHIGSIVRVNRDGSVPDDNPFVNTPDVLPEIWSFGHRNPQGAALDANGTLWTSEHGAKGGDEVNRIQKGANYGWPVISYGVHYSGARIGEGTAKEGMQQPALYWDPSIAPSGLMVYSGKMFPDWQGDIFVGSLKFDYIARLDGTPLTEVAQIKNAATDRVRDIVEAPDGSIWFISVGNGSVYRIAKP